MGGFVRGHRSGVLKASALAACVVVAACVLSSCIYNPGPIPIVLPPPMSSTTSTSATSTTTTTLPQVPNALSNIALRLGDPCTAADPVNGAVPGTQIQFYWTASATGPAVTGYALTVFITLPGESQTTMSLPSLPASQTDSGWSCYPIGTSLGPEVVAFNDAGTSPSSGYPGGVTWVPTTGLAWTSPASISDGVPSSYAPIDFCPKTGPDGKLVGAEFVQVTLTTASGSQYTLGTVGQTGKWSVDDHLFNNGGVQDLSATVLAQCISYPNSGGPLLTAQYATHTIAVNP